jgi:hypothetical protein
MKRTGRHALRLGALTVALAVLTVAGGLVGGARGAAADYTASFSDPSGDPIAPSGGTVPAGSPDIVTVNLHDDGTLVQFSVGMAGPLQPYQIYIVLIDSDNSVSTGDSSGIDVELAALIRPDGSLFNQLQRWNPGSGKMEAVSSATATASSDSTHITWQASRADLGGNGTFNFAVGAVGSDANISLLSVDAAPNGGNWAYQIGGPPATTTTTTAPPPPPPVTKPVHATLGLGAATPHTLRAGTKATVGFRVGMSDGSAFSGTRAVHATATLAGKTLAHTTAVRGGKLLVTLKLPATAKGKRLVVSATVSRGTTVKRSASFTIH